MTPNPLNRSNPEKRPAPLMTAVIVNYNGWNDVRRLVSSLGRTPEVALGGCAVIVVDNASQEPIPADLANEAQSVQVILLPDNGGFAAGVNSGWRAAESPWILVLNPDVVIPPGQLGRIAARAARCESSSPQAPGIVGFALRNPDGSRQPSVGVFPNLARTIWEQLIPRSRRKYQTGWRTRSGPVDWVTGACVLINRRLLEQLGGMDEDFFLYYEEVALCRAARDGGWNVEYDDSAEVVHLHPLQNRAISPKMRVITRHSKLLYFRKFLPNWQFRALSMLVNTEAAIRGAWSRARRRSEDGRAWGAIGELTRAFRAGTEPRGRDVRRLAESVAAPAPPSAPSGWPRNPPGIGTAGKRRGTSGATSL